MKITQSLVLEVVSYVNFRDNIPSIESQIENQQKMEELKKLRKGIENRIMFADKKTSSQIKKLGINQFLFQKSTQEILRTIENGIENTNSQ